MRRIVFLSLIFMSFFAFAGDNETARFLGPEADWKYARVELRNMRGLYGATYVALCGSGSVSVRSIEGGKERRFLFSIGEKEARAILEKAVANDLVAQKPPTRSGIPDEGREIVALESPLGLERSAWYWATGPVPAIDEVGNPLRALVAKTAKLEPVYEGKPDGFFRPFEAVVATVALYSGRPDPSFEILKEDDWETLRALTKDLEKTARPERTAPPLGYRGFLLAPRGVPGLPKWLSVYEGVIQAGESPRDVTYMKDARGLEAWLKEAAKKRGIEEGAPR